jgi:hypothetical protein
MNGTRLTTMQRSTLSIFIVVGLFHSLLPEATFSQGETTSAIVGQVSDASGAAVRSATVTVTNKETGLRRSASTDDSGRFNFPQLKPGAYSVKVEAEGFEPKQNDAVSAALGQKQTVDLFVETFTATDESWAAACIVLEAASSSNVLKMLGWRISGRLERAKTLLASMVNGDLAVVNGISVALHHIVDGLHKMRQLAANPTLRSSMTAGAAVDECLFAPTAVVRQAKTSGEVGGCPFKRGSLFILGLGSARKGAAIRDLVFLSQSWSRCPAEKWVPALLEGVWTRVSATLGERLVPAT